MPEIEDLEILNAFKDLLANNWDELPEDVLHDVKNALSKSAEDEAEKEVLANVLRAAEAVEEQTEFDVIIKDAGPKKIEVIKAIRQLTSLGLKEAKDLAETAGGKVLEAVGKDAANDAKSKLETAGAVVEVA